MASTITLKWKNNTTFESVIDGHKLSIDTSVDMGGNDEGPRPKVLMLLSLAGCSGLDIASLFHKMRVVADRLEIEVSGELSDTVPAIYTSFHIVYRVWGKDDDRDKIIKAIRLSEEKYCGVAVMYRKIGAVTYDIFINDNKISL
ncbi:MAG TPA: OsmC family protein [Candidatus Gallibacteroides avistercoris]|uniref:OsmC family protein n=1 Tax=Candidatus Gallibacteroides avistercoris TaxID=2840833 RepID=A0A9D1M7D5_9BACT|nr:OsmC family protein [Candidatus Gallibacteroides avistercoris]